MKNTVFTIHQNEKRELGTNKLGHLLYFKDDYIDVSVTYDNKGYLSFIQLSVLKPTEKEVIKSIEAVVEKMIKTHGFEPVIKHMFQYIEDNHTFILSKVGFEKKSDFIKYLKLQIV